MNTIHRVNYLYKFTFYELVWSQKIKLVFVQSTCHLLEPIYSKKFIFVIMPTLRAFFCNCVFQHEKWGYRRTCVIKTNTNSGCIAKSLDIFCYSVNFGNVSRRKVSCQLTRCSEGAFTFFGKARFAMTSSGESRIFCKAFSFTNWQKRSPAIEPYFRQKPGKHEQCKEARKRSVWGRER